MTFPEERATEMRGKNGLRVLGSLVTLFRRSTYRQGFLAPEQNPPRTPGSSWPSLLLLPSETQHGQTLSRPVYTTNAILRSAVSIRYSTCHFSVLPHFFHAPLRKPWRCPSVRPAQWQWPLELSELAECCCRDCQWPDPWGLVSLWTHLGRMTPSAGSSTQRTIVLRRGDADPRNILFLRMNSYPIDYRVELVLDMVSGCQGHHRRSVLCLFRVSRHSDGNKLTSRCLVASWLRDINSSLVLRLRRCMSLSKDTRFTVVSLVDYNTQTHMSTLTE